MVQRDKVGIGFNNIAYAYDINSKKPYRHIAVIPLDLNGNGKIDPEEDFYATSTELNAAIAEGKYPSPPAQEPVFGFEWKTDETGSACFSRIYFDRWAAICS